MWNAYYAWISLLAASTLAAMVPGAAFALVLRNSTTISRSAGIMTAVGLSLGIAFHALLILTGLGACLVQVPLVYQIIRWGGACYLIYLGVSCFCSAKKRVLVEGAEGEVYRNNQKNREFVWQGFCTNATNPKVILFFLALFVQFLTPDMSIFQSGLYAASVSAIELLWFSVVAILLTHSTLQKAYANKTHWIERASGFILVCLGFMLFAV